MSPGTLATVNGVGIGLLGMLCLLGAGGILHYLISKDSPFRDLAFLGACAVGGVGLLFLLASWPMLHRTTIAATSPWLLFVLSWGSVILTGAAVLRFRLRWRSVERWNVGRRLIEDELDRVLTEDRQRMSELNIVFSSWRQQTWSGERTPSWGGDRP